jgi:hypothetical protein
MKRDSPNKKTAVKVSRFEEFISLEYRKIPATANKRKNPVLKIT